MLTSIIILTYNNFSYTKQCIESIRKFTNKQNYEIIVVDNDSRDETREWLMKQTDIKTIFNDENVGFPKGCNQGIIIAKGENILLLNNDIILTYNWLNNLVKALYSDKRIGAVGPVSNSVTYNQRINIPYEDIDEMQVFAKKYNISDKEKWKFTMKLIGYCLLIKKEVVDKIGLLDERFTPGNFEDDDYSLRIIESGYDLLLCKDTFIHHFGGSSFKLQENYSKLLKTNSDKFHEKWTFSSEKKINISSIYNNFINKEVKSVFEFNCGCGANILELKNANNSLIVNGYDENIKAYKIAQKYCDTDINKYDLVIISDINSVENAKEIIKQAKEKVAIHGNLIIIFQNTRCIREIYLVNELGGNLDFEFDIKLIKELRSEDLVVENILFTEISEEDKEIFRSLVNSFEKPFEDIYVGQYCLKIKSGNNTYINEILENIDKEIDVEKNIKCVIKTLEDNSVSIDDLIYLISKSNFSSLLINNLAVLCYENQLFHLVIPIFEVGIIKYAQDNLLLLNYCEILFELSEYEKCLNNLLRIDDEQFKLDDQYKKLKELCETRETIKCYLINLHDSIDIDNALENIINLLNLEKVKEKEIFKIIDKYLINKEEVLNKIAVFAYEKKVYDYVIPFLNKAYEINPTNYDTVHNLISFLEDIGESELANKYYNNFMNKDDNKAPKKESNHIENKKYDYRVEEKYIDCNSKLSKEFNSFGENSYIDKDYRINKFENIFIGNNTFIKDNCWLNVCVDGDCSEPKVIIKDGCQIGSRFSISVSNKCVIEKNVIIGPNVYIADCEHNYENIGVPIMYQGITSLTNEVIIGENSRIETNSVIVGNVHIGKGCVIGANSYVTKDVPDYSVVVGNPAKIVKMFDAVSQEWVKVRNNVEIIKTLETRKNQPLISICIPTFNRAKELEKCLSSIYSEIGNDSLFEVFISNNNSTDNTEEIISKYSNLYNNIIYNKNEINIGAENNIALTIEESKGKYIILHGDDDYFKGNTIYQLMNIINTYRQQSLFFVNVLSNTNEVKLCSGINEFLKEISIGSAFISSIIIKREEYRKTREPFEFIGTSLNQIYLQYKILLNNPDFIIINTNIFNYEANPPTGYNFGKVFIKNYLDILNYFIQYGLKEEIVKQEKLKMLKTHTIPWYKSIIDNKIGIDITGFEEYFKEYYKNEVYFEEAYKIIEDIKKAGEN